MNIAVAVRENNVSGRIPDTYDDAAGLLIISVEENSHVVAYIENDFVRNINEEWHCEALLSGPFLNKDDFISIADYGVTRYNGAGMTVEEAFTAFLDGALPLITDYEGGTGCGDHDDSIIECSGGCEQDECSGDCNTCHSPC